MSILIKGAKPPSGCAFCYFNDDSKCALIPGCNYDETNGWQRRDDCPLIELPDHGDLIDRDAVKPKDCHGCPYNGGCYAHDLLNDSPVVIPAERGLSPVMPITNADRIRQMSDDELATLFGDACACLYDDADVCEKFGGACDRCWLDWLKQEVDDDRT